MSKRAIFTDIDFDLVAYETLVCGAVFARYIVEVVPWKEGFPFKRVV